MVLFSFRKKLLKGKNALFEALKVAKAQGRLLGVLRYVQVEVAVKEKCSDRREVCFFSLSQSSGDR